MWVFSNFQPAEVTYEGERYPTVEHAYQAAKTVDVEQRVRIRAAATPGRAKRLGRTVTLRADWDEVKQSVMSMLLTQKLSREPWRSILLATGDTMLVEWTTWHDTYWGRCTCREHNGAGQNVLGQLLMGIREALRT